MTSLELKLMLMPDKTKKRILWISTITIIIVATIGISCLVYISSIPEPLGGVRPEACLVKPDIPEKVDDIRITFVERDCGLDTMGAPYSAYTAIQIYYGYCYNGEWYDYPSENYDLCGIFFPNDDNYGFEAAGDDHIVEIGDKILIAITPFLLEYTAKITDTLDTEVIMKDEYATVNTVESGKKYAYFKENALRLYKMDYGYGIHGGFSRWYFLVLNKDDIDESYSLTYNNNEYVGVPSRDKILTYNDIQTLLENAKKQ